MTKDKLFSIIKKFGIALHNGLRRNMDNNMFETKLLEFMNMLQSGCDVAEWYLADFIEKNINHLSSQEAFSGTSYVIQLMGYNLRSDCLYELLQILVSLQRQSDTTQRPLALMENPEIFDLIVTHNSQDYILCIVDELKTIWA